MFGLFKKKGSDKDLAAIEKKIAAIQGQLNGNEVLTAYLFDIMPEDYRKRLSDHIKDVVGKGYAGNPQWLEGPNKKSYQDSMSAVLQRAIKVLDGNE